MIRCLKTFHGRGVFLRMKKIIGFVANLKNIFINAFNLFLSHFFMRHDSLEEEPDEEADVRVEAP